MRYSSLLSSVRNTPCVRISRVAPEHVRVFVKLEGRNPCSSQEDRLGFCRSSSVEWVAEQLGLEILRDFSTLPLDYCVTAAPGTGLTTGLRNLFAEHSPGIQVVASQIAPQALPLAPGKNISVSAADALQAMNALAQQEGIITGLLGGAVLAGALQIAAQAVSGSHIVCVLPFADEQSQRDTVSKRDCGLSEEERAIAASTADQRPPVRMADEEPFVADLSQKLLGQFLAGEELPVLLFAYKWCETAKSVQKLLKELCVPFRCVDLDADLYQAGQVGLRLKAALIVHTGLTTLPQVFVAGDFLGGSVELFDAVNNRSLFGMLDRAGVQYNHELQLDPYALPPGQAQAPSAEVRLN